MADNPWAVVSQAPSTADEWKVVKQEPAQALPPGDDGLDSPFTTQQLAGQRTPPMDAQLPFQTPPGQYRYFALPMMEDEKTKKRKLAWPGFIADTANLATKGWQVAAGERSAGSVAGADAAMMAAMGIGLPPGSAAAGRVAPRPLIMGREARETLRDNATKSKAADRLTKRLNQDLGVETKTPESLLNELGEGRALGKPLTIMDVAGPNVVGEAGRVARAPGESKSIMGGFLDERDAGALARSEEDIARDLGTGPSAKRTEEGLRQAQSQVGIPLYEKAFEGGSLAPLQQQMERSLDQTWAQYHEAASVAEQARTQLREAMAARDAAFGGRSFTAEDSAAAQTANQAVRDAEIAVRRADGNVAALEREKQQIAEVLQQAMADGSANAPGAIWSPRIQQFLDDPITKAGQKRGLEIQRLEALAAGKRFDPSEYAIIGTNEAGEPIVGKVPNMRLLNATKKGLDAIIEADRTAGGGRLTEHGRAVDQVRRSFLAELDSRHPDYATARAAWQGDAASIDATNFGKKIVSEDMSEETVRDFIAGATPSDMEFVRIGLADDLLKRVAKTRGEGDEAKRVLKDEWEKRAVKPVFRSQEDFDRYVKSVVLERLMFARRNAIQGNSMSANRLAEDGAQNMEMGAHLMTGASHVVHQNWLATAASWFRIAKALAIKTDPKADAEIARLLRDTEMTPRLDTKGKMIVPPRLGRQPFPMPGSDQSLLQQLGGLQSTRAAVASPGSPVGLPHAAMEAVNPLFEPNDPRSGATP